MNFQDFKVLMNNGLEEIERKNPDSILLSLKSYNWEPTSSSKNKNQLDQNNGNSWRKNGNDLELNYLSGINNL